MTDTQLYLAIGVPIVVNILFNGTMAMLLSNHFNARLTALQSEFRALLDAQEKLFTEKLLRVEQVMDARLRLMADDYTALRSKLDREVADETAVRQRQATVEAELSLAQRRESDLEAAAQAEAPRLSHAQETWFGLSALKERLHGVADLAAERHRHLSAEPDEERRGRDPEELVEPRPWHWLKKGPTSPSTSSSLRAIAASILRL